jgi:hypothetical protein
LWVIESPGRVLTLKQLNIENQIQVKSEHHVVLTSGQKADNRGKSKVRCRVKHVFGLINTSMSGLLPEYIGLKRSTVNDRPRLSITHMFAALGIRDKRLRHRRLFAEVVNLARRHG